MVSILVCSRIILINSLDPPYIVMGMREQMHINSFILLISSRDYFAARAQPLTFIMRPIDLLDHFQFGLQYFLILVLL